MTPSLPLAYLGVIVATFFWGTNFNVGAYIIAHQPPISASIERFSLATLMLLLVFGLRGQLRLSALKNNWPAYLGLGVLGFTVFNLCTFFGLQSTSPVNGALILATTPLWTMVFSVIWEHEKLSPARVTGLLSGFIGVALVITQGDIQTLLRLDISPGDGIILLGSLAWALNMVGTRRWVRNATAVETTSYSMLFGTLALLPLGMLFEDPRQSLAAAPLGVHAAVAYLALCGSLLAYLLWFNGLEKIGSVRTAIFFNLAPVFTMLVATLTGHTPNLWQLAGAAWVILGVLLASGALRRLAPAHPAARQP
ncbi:DMT family transporter [Serratia ficaria]|uniref:Threonine/homoserine exporter RhtA n=1 Tax=Serratia ficaria TaxID=61651 RepID=A0A240BLJ1_SERFI|nr:MULTISPECIES: DMT family transporter [Serratia]MEE4483610.1 DMT family transporter [Serratia ficaria]REF45781.1 drug/metabolite transporter (DMT)-like permease [Serratia ficaria]CAI0815354.1 putative DMT superfamily transporter inner membrane protein [Serratia ficaria]CAI0849386.1 putative DMT superfamily transporter inner membrane protein [Serratia ficaria]CAI0861513.1 putative DMT superfamily transporter inner membrane protein [Serratia ficaria]